MNSIQNHFHFKLIILLLLTITSLVITPIFGSSEFSFDSLTHSETFRQIFFDLRLPRICFAFLVGFSLALVGAIFQALLRNELATPYTLGVSSGGALGAVLAIKMGLELHFLGFSSIPLFSIFGSFGTMLIIYFIARSKIGISSLTLVLTGITVSLFFSSLILFIHYLADFTETYRMIRWMMGGLQIIGWQYVYVLLILVLIIFIFFLTQTQALNILSAGKELAMSKGVDVTILQKRMFFTGSLLIGFIVALAGPIGFVGLIVPHLVRLWIGADHRKLIPAASMLGGVFLLWCDTFARIIIAPAELPVGVVTALLGGPFFIWLLVRHKKQV